MHLSFTSLRIKKKIGTYKLNCNIINVFIFFTKATRRPAKAGGTCLIIFEFVVLMREMGNFKNSKIEANPKPFSNEIRKKFFENLKFSQRQHFCSNFPLVERSLGLPVYAGALRTACSFYWNQNQILRFGKVIFAK